jgi:hypothetical protein
MEKMSVNVTPSFGATIIDIENDVVKPYRADYPLPESVRQSILGFQILQEKLEKDSKEKDKEEWRKLNRDTYCKDSKRGD